MSNVLILGDSISTFEGCIPKEFKHYYSQNVIKNTDVCEVSHMWWSAVAKSTCANIILNSSFSGTTICNTGWHGEDCDGISFVSRLDKLIDEGFFEKNSIDAVWLFGGTNDSWALSPLGEEKHSDWTKKDLYFVFPAFSYLLKRLRESAPDARIIAILNNDLSPEIRESYLGSCARYGAEAVLLKDIEKIDGHPNKKGMMQIAEQLISHLKK